LFLFHSIISYDAPRKISGEHIVAALSVRPSVRPIRVRTITSLFKVGFQNYFTEMTTMLKRCVAHNIWVLTLKVKVTAWPCSTIVSSPYLCFLKSDFKNISQKWSPYWDDVSRAIFASLPWRSRSQHDLVAKSCPAHNFVIWSRIPKLFHRNDHQIEMTCRAQHLGRYLEGQGHSMTLQQNCVRPITLLFEVGFWNYFTEMITILRRRVTRQFGSLPWRSRSPHDLAAKLCPVHNFVVWSQISKQFHINDHHIETTCRLQHLGCYLEGQGHSMTFQQNSFRLITWWFEVEFYNYFTGMITILRQHVVCNIWNATLKAKVTAWPCSKIVSGPKLCYLKLDFTTTFDKLLLCVQYLFGEHYMYPVPTGSCLFPYPTRF